MQPLTPCSFPTCWWQTRVSGLLLCWQLWLGAYSVCVCVCFFPLPVMLPSEIPKLPTDPPVRGFPGVWKFPLTTPSPGRVSIPNSFFSLFIFYILSYLLSKTMGCLSGCLVSSTSIQKLFCGICSAFKWSFDEFVGEKVVSPSCSSAIFFFIPLNCLKKKKKKSLKQNKNRQIFFDVQGKAFSVET